MWFFKASVRSCCTKLLLEAAPASQSCSPKPRPKVVIESCSNQLLPKAAKVPPKVVAESCFLKLFPKTVVFQNLFVNAAAKPQSCSPQLFPKVVFQSYCRKLSAKKFFQTAHTSYGSRHSEGNRRWTQEAGNLAEVHLRKNTKIITHKLGEQRQ